MKHFLAGRPTVDAPALRPPSGACTELPVGSALKSTPAAAGSHHAGHGPTVECVKQGDKVVRLVITCACGERIEVECLYPAGG